jgi:DNA polymerase-3 subunit delta'
MIKSDIEINENVLKRFAGLEKKGLLAHAYLFVGPAYIGKAATAFAVAKFLNCENKKEGGERYSCDRCPSCLRINAGNHPDIHVLEVAPGESIKIDAVRELLAQIRLRPFMAAKKIFIVHNIEDLTTEGANALLKTLEEPSANSLLILTTAVPERVLETVKSRCHVIPFVPASQRALAARLVQYYDEDKDQAHFLAYFAEGCLGKARRFKEDGFCAAKDEIIDRYILGREREALIKTIGADKAKTKEFLDVLLSWIRDCLLVQTGVQDARLVHAGRIRELQNFQRRFSFEELSGIHRETVNACRLLTENLNVKIPLSIIGEMLWAK